MKTTITKAKYINIDIRGWSDIEFTKILHEEINFENEGCDELFIRLLNSFSSKRYMYGIYKNTFAHDEFRYAFYRSDEARVELYKNLTGVVRGMNEIVNSILKDEVLKIRL